MPIYEYVCLDCGERFDALRLMRAADSPIPCRRCSGERTRRLISVFFSQSAGSLKSSTPGSAPSSGGCAGCSGGSCSTCGH